MFVTGVARVLRRGVSMPPVGRETLKVLAGAVARPSFTVAELADEVGVSRSTTETVVSRYGDYFHKAGSEHPGSPGRPAVRWAVRDDRLADLDEVVASYRPIASRSDLAAVEIDPDEADTSLLMAIKALSLAQSSDESAEILVSAARTNLRNAGFTPDGEALAGTAPSGQQLAKARAIAAVGTALEANVTGDEHVKEGAQVGALHALKDSMPVVNAEEWVPLANTALHAWGTVIATPLVVPQEDWSYVHGLLPGLRRIRSGFRHAVCAVDEHLYPYVTALGPAMRPLTAVLQGVRTRLEEPVVPRARILVVSPGDDLAAAIMGGAQIVLADDGSLALARAQIARRTAEVALYDVEASLPASLPF
jgi:hypothetical protein